MLIPQTAPSATDSHKRLASLEKIFKDPAAFGLSYQGARRNLNDQVMALFSGAVFSPSVGTSFGLEPCSEMEAVERVGS